MNPVLREVLLFLATGAAYAAAALLLHTGLKSVHLCVLGRLASGVLAAECLQVAWWSWQSAQQVLKPQGTLHTFTNLLPLVALVVILGLGLFWARTIKRVLRSHRVAKALDTSK